MSEYFLGTSDHELERLAFQQEIWRGPTDSFLEALGPLEGKRVLDLGCGPGLATAELRKRVGAAGEVVAVDESERWVRHVDAVAEHERWENVRTVQARLQDLELEEGLADGAVMRWVLSFLPDPAGVLGHIARFVRPGGFVGVMDYNHLGVSMFPRSEGFDAVIRATRRAYAVGGGDTFIMGSIHRHFRAAGLEPSKHENFVLSGGPDSPAFQWADRFFPFHVPRLTESGVLSSADAELFDEEWAARKADPDSLFFSPIVVASVARKPKAR